MKIETVEDLYKKGFRTLNIVAAGEAEALEDEVTKLKKENEELKDTLSGLVYWHDNSNHIDEGWWQLARELTKENK